MIPCPKPYQADTLPKCIGQGIQGIHSRAQPHCQHLINVIAKAGPVGQDLLFKHKANGAWRVAGLEWGGEWVSKKIGFREFFVCLQGIIEISLEVGRCSKGDGSCSRQISISRHEGGGR